VGDKWSWQGKGLMDVSINDQSRVEAEEDVECVGSGGMWDMGGGLLAT